jgi:hypothetical protein
MKTLKLSMLALVAVVATSCTYDNRSYNSKGYEVPIVAPTVVQPIVRPVYVEPVIQPVYVRPVVRPVYVRPVVYSAYTKYSCYDY